MKQKSIRLTIGMLEAMGCALDELLAGESPQGFNEDSDESAKVMENADKANLWVALQLQRRREKNKSATT
jgi:hypothetical protein